MSAHFNMKTCDHCGYTLNFPGFLNGCDGKCIESREYSEIEDMKKDQNGATQASELP